MGRDAPETVATLDGGVVALTDTAWFSPPNSMELANPAHGLGGAGVSVSSDFVGPMRGVHCAFQLYVASRGNNNLDTVALNVASADGMLYLGTMTVLYGGGGAFGVNGAVAAIADAPTGKWTSFVLDAVFAQGTALTINGVPQSVPDGGLSDAGPTNASITFSASESGADMTGWSIYLDNVRCDPIP
jgi:hypothetical protein